MDHSHLIGRPFSVRGADPALFGAPLAGVVHAIDASAQLLLLKLVPPIQLGSEACRFAVAKPRLQRDTLDTLSAKAIVGCGITCIPDSRYDQANPFNLSWWRGGGAMIADLVVTPEDDK